jgi:hypothetical protein
LTQTNNEANNVTGSSADPVFTCVTTDLKFSTGEQPKSCPAVTAYNRALTGVGVASGPDAAMNTTSKILKQFFETIRGRWDYRSHQIPHAPYKWVYEPGKRICHRALQYNASTVAPDLPDPNEAHKQLKNAPDRGEYFLYPMVGGAMKAVGEFLDEGFSDVAGWAKNKFWAVVAAVVEKAQRGVQRRQAGDCGEVERGKGIFRNRGRQGKTVHRVAETETRGVRRAAKAQVFFLLARERTFQDLQL